MSNINKELEKILSARYGKDVRQSIHDAIKEIDAVADTAQDSATKMAAMAGNHEASAKASMESALASAESALRSAEQAMSGTPEGYEALVNQVGLLDIKTSNDSTLYNSKKGGYRLNDLVGNTEQNGEPTSDNPISIENTFDGVEMMQGNWDLSTGAYTQDSSSVCTKHSIPCQKGDIITFSTEKPLRYRITLFKNGAFIASSHFGNGSNLTSKTYTVTSECDSFKFHVYNTRETMTPQTVGKITITVNGKYVGQIVELGGDELLKTEVISGNLNSSGAVETDSTWGHKIVEVDSGYNYYLSNSNMGSTPKHCWYDSTMKFISAVNSDVATKLLTPPSNARYLGVSYVKTNKNIMLQKQKVTTFFLNEPLRATDRVVRKDGVWNENHKRGSIVFDGVTNKFTYKSGNTGNNGFMFDSSLYLDKIKKVSNGNQVANVLCSHAKPIAYNLMNTDIVGISQHQNGQLYLSFGLNSELTTIELANQWLVNNPTTVEYELAEETYTPLDTESQLALNNMETFDGVTYIEVDSKVKPTSISGEYGTSQVGALALENANLHDTVNLTTVKGSVANNLTTTEEGFVLDARMGKLLMDNITAITPKTDKVSVDLKTATWTTTVDGMYYTEIKHGLIVNKVLGAFIQNWLALAKTDIVNVYVPDNNTIGIMSNNNSFSSQYATLSIQLTYL